MVAPLIPPAGLWLHDEPAGLVRAVELGYDVAARASWGSVPTPEAVRALHGFLIETCALRARLAGSISETPGQSPELTIDPRPRAGVPAERVAASRLLARTPEVLQGSALSSGIATRTAPGDAGALPAVAIVAIVVVGAAAVAYCAHQAAAVIDRDLARDAELQKLAALHAQTMALVRSHVEREQAAGKQIPLDAASKAALQSLGAAQQTIAERTETPLEPLGSLGAAAASSAKEAGKWFGLSSGALLVVAGVVLYLMR